MAQHGSPPFSFSAQFSCKIIQRIIRQTREGPKKRNINNRQETSKFQELISKSVNIHARLVTWDIQSNVP